MEAIGGASFCLNEDIEAYVALQDYDDEWASVIERCGKKNSFHRRMEHRQVCADEDIAAEKELRGE